MTKQKLQSAKELVTLLNDHDFMVEETSLYEDDNGMYRINLLIEDKQMDA